jgi:hypothetical protein
VQAWVVPDVNTCPGFSAIDGQRWSPMWWGVLELGETAWASLSGVTTHTSGLKASAVYL